MAITINNNLNLDSYHWTNYHSIEAHKFSW